jgi:lactate dehydrogenase-like 2-hydroxyacid dehydrogenase
VLTDATAEMAWTLLFAVARWIVESDAVMRYRDLMRELAAYTRNTLRFSQAEKATLTLYPTPSPLQQKAFDLLRLNPAL